MAKYLDGTGLSKAFELIKAWVTANFLSDVSYNSTSKKIQKTKNGTTSDVVTLATVATSGSYNDLSNRPTIPSEYTLPDANATTKGGVKLSDATDGTQTAASGVTAATPKAVADALDAAKAYADANDEDTTYGLSISGRTISLVDNGSTQSVTVPETEIDVFDGATGSAAGASGLVPAPASGETTKLLWSDGNWKTIEPDLTTNNGNLYLKLYKRNSGTGGEGRTQVSSDDIPLSYLWPSVASASAAGLMSSSDFGKLSRIADGAEVNVQSDWNQADSTADDYIKNKPTIPNPSIYHAVCETATSTAAKTATLDDSSGFPSSSQLTAGVVVAVTFMNGNSAASPTLNIQNTGAYPLRIEGRSPASTSVQTAPIIDGNSHCTLLLTFNGSQWVEYEQFNGFGTAAWKDYQDSSSASALSTGTDLVTERDVYHGLPKINNAHNYTSGTNIYAPTSAGTSGYYLKANGGTSAPTWQAPGSVADGNTGLVTGDAVYDAIQDALSDVAGALVYKGTAANASAISGTSYKKGWYWIASATFALTSGINVEPGDMIIAKQDKTSTFANDIDVVQTNIDTLTDAEVTALWNAA